MNRSRLTLALVTLFASGGTHAAALLEVAPEATVEVPAFGYAAGKAFREPLALRRIDVYAADAKVYVARTHGLEEMPRSGLRLFVGAPEEPQRLFLAVDPEGGTFEGAVLDHDGTFAIRGRLTRHGLKVDGGERIDDRGTFRCGGSPAAPDPAVREQAGAKPVEIPPRPKGILQQATVAVDTDNELMQLKFSDNASAANNYIAALFAGMNVFYERDLDLRLVVGTVILRPSNVPDPYTVAGGSPGDPLANLQAQLDEFGEVWRTTQQAVPRAFAMQLSVKSGGGNEFAAAGLAWILDTPGQNYCAQTGQVFGNRTFGHFSTTRVFRFGGATAANDVAVVGHELGHNFGALHTHCASATTGHGPTASNTIDTCWGLDPGCYSGPVACPVDNSVIGRGSLMSYCNFGPPAANCGAVLNEFHPAQQIHLDARIASNLANGCFAPFGGNVGPQVSAVAPASGSSTPLGGGFVGNRVSGSITFAVGGGSGTGTTGLTCSVGSGTVAITSGTPQTIAVNGSAAPVGVRFTLTGGSQSGVVNCSAVRQNGATSNFTYTFTASAGTSPPANRVHCSGFEINEVVSCTQ